MNNSDLESTTTGRKVSDTALQRNAKLLTIARNLTKKVLSKIDMWSVNPSDRQDMKDLTRDFQAIDAGQPVGDVEGEPSNDKIVSERPCRECKRLRDALAPDPEFGLELLEPAKNLIQHLINTCACGGR